METPLRLFLDKPCFNIVFGRKGENRSKGHLEGHTMKQDKLESILETAKRMFARYGLKKTSIDEVARAASVAKGTIYSYIGTKDMVYLEVLNQEVDGIIEGISSAVERESSPTEKLAVFVKSKFRCMRQAAVILGLDRDGLEKLLPSVEGLRNDFFEREVMIITSILKEGVEKGVFRRIEDHSLAARAIGYALRGFEIKLMAQENKEGIEHYLSQLVELLLWGLASQESEERPKKLNPPCKLSS